MVPRKRQDSTESTGDLHRMMEASEAGFFLKSTTISIVFRELSARLLWLHLVTRWSTSHL